MSSHRHGLVESRMRGDAHVRFGGAGRGNGPAERLTPRPSPTLETLDQARNGIGGYVDRYHHRPHSGLNYRTPLAVRQTWEDHQDIAA